MADKRWAVDVVSFGAQPAADAVGTDVLVVDADVHERRLLAHALQRAGFSVVEAATGREALAHVGARPFAAMLLATSMPDLSGVDVVRLVRDREETSAMAVLLLTAADELNSRVRGLEAGADATIVRPLHAAELVARVRAHLGRDVPDDRTVEDRLRDRSSIAAALAAVAPADSAEATAESLCERLCSGEIEGAAVVLFPGDGTVTSFATAGMVPALLHARRPMQPAVARHLLERARMGPWTEAVTRDDGLRAWPPPGPSGGGWTAATHSAAASGCSVAYAPLVTGRELLGVLALCSSAETGSIASMHTLAAAIDFGAIAQRTLLPHLLERGHLAERRADIEHVIEEHAFATVFQPIVDLVSQEVAGFEALTRFHDGSAPADRFAEAARISMGTDLEAAAVRGALEAARNLPGQLWLSLNVSPALVLEGDRLEAAVAEADRPIVLELTEHDPVEDYDALREAVRRLGPRMRLSIDDAGSGFASLRHVLALDPAFVKLDQSWVHHVHADPARQALLAGLVYFASRTGCRLIAEGVETEADLDTLRGLEVELGQGFLLGRPAAV